MTSRTSAVHDIVASLVGEPGIVSAMLATDDGEIVAVCPMSADSWEAQITAEWAADRIERFSGLRKLVGERELSILIDPKDSPGRTHCHLQSLQGHVLLVFFSNRDFLGRIRAACRDASARLGHVLLES